MTRKQWIWLIGVGIIYAVIGVGFGEIAKHVPANQGRAWRLGAWVASALVYAVHVGYEQFRLKQRSLDVALHIAIAVGVGGFLLAVSAFVHALTVGTTAPLRLYGIALVAWPLLTAVPAFIVTLIASLVANRIK
jgi:hypothetical protein